MKAEIKKRLEAIRHGETLEGYNTKLGMCPESWKKIKLSEICEKITKKNIGNSIKTVFTNSAIDGVILQSKYFDKCIANEENTENYYIVEKKDFIYNPRISSNAAYGPISPNELNINGIVSPLYTVFRQIDTKNVIFEYLKYFFASSQWHEYIYSIGNYGVRFDRINILDDDFFNMPIIIPPISDQKEIVKIIKQCEEIIALKVKYLSEKRKLKKWLLENLLNPNSGVRLPGFKGEWKEKRLGELGVFSKGFGISNDDCLTGDYPCIKYGDIYMRYNYFVNEVVSHTEEEIANNSKIINSGSLLFTGSGEDPLEIGKCVVYLGKEKVAVGGDIIIMTPKEVNSLFLSYQQYTSKMINRKAELAQGYSVVHIYTDLIKSLKVSIPSSIKEQEAIADILYQIDTEVNLLDRELAEWCVLKKALMQVLLMGIVRV